MIFFFDKEGDILDISLGEPEEATSRELGDDIIYCRERVKSPKGGCIRDRTYCTRLYSPEKISDLMHSAGFSSISCHKNFMNREAEVDYGCMTNRMIVTAKRK